MTIAMAAIMPHVYPRHRDMSTLGEGVWRENLENLDTHFFAAFSWHFP